MSSPRSALVLLAPGFEEIEAITVIDLLRRAEIEVVTAGLADGVITASRQTRHLADTSLATVEHRLFDVVILPGGAEGTKNLGADPRTQEIVRRHWDAERYVAAICAAPTLLKALDWLGASKLICHPSVQSQIPADKLAAGSRVVIDGRLITGLAAGSALEFSFALVHALCGPEIVAKVNGGVCFPEIKP